jgi:hypothetical protein
MMTAEVMMTRACCDDQGIIRQRTIVQQDALTIYVDAHCFREKHVGVFMVLEDSAQGGAMLAAESQPVETW